eukprot:138493-Pelagomonas_calceolata.AAC.3
MGLSAGGVRCKGRPRPRSQSRGCPPMRSLRFGVLRSGVWQVACNVRVGMLYPQLQSEGHKMPATLQWQFQVLHEGVWLASRAKWPSPTKVHTAASAQASANVAAMRTVHHQAQSHQCKKERHIQLPPAAGKYAGFRTPNMCLPMTQCSSVIEAYP